MKTKRFFNTLLASVMLAATAGLMVSCTSSIDNTVVTPTEPEENPAVNELLTDFVKTVSGIEKYQQSQADYSNPDNWLKAESDGQQEVDVFYIYPSNYTPAAGEPAIGDIDNAGMRKGAQAIYERQATAFKTSCNIYAPYYRQVDGTFCLQLTTEQEWSLIRYQASQDLSNALEYYFNNWNNGKPFILAGHSQGSENLLALLQDYFHQDDAHEALLKRMVAAYAIGFSVTDEYLAANPDIPFATRHNDVGCIVSWNTEGPANKGHHNAVVKPHAHSINPIYWVTDDTYVPASENLGSLTSIEEGIVEPGIADAQLDLERGVVVVSTEAAKPFAIPAAMQDLFGPESYHGQDYGFFYGDIRRNAEQRIAGFYSQNIQSGMGGAPLLSEATSEDVGKVIGADSRIYDAVYKATAAGTTASGIIVYVGEPGSVDTNSTFYRGLAISLKDFEPYQWFSTGESWYSCTPSYSIKISEAVKFKDGIVRTEILVKSDGSVTNCNNHNHPAAVKAYNYSAPRPHGTSIWFLPSLGQWNLIAQGIASKKYGRPITENLKGSRSDYYLTSKINSVLTGAGGQGFSNGWMSKYWTSTQYFSTKAWTVDFALGGKAQDFDKRTERLVRPVFAF